MDGFPSVSEVYLRRDTAVSEYGMEWMSGGAKRQCDRTARGGGAMARAADNAGEDLACRLIAVVEDGVRPARSAPVQPAVPLA